MKSVLYSVTLASETFGDVGALAWPALAATQSDALRRSPSRWAIDTMPVVQRLVERHDATLVALLVSDLNGCFVRTDIAAAETPMCTRIAELTGDALAHLDAVIAGRQPTTPDDDVVAMLWSVLETAAVAIGETADDIDLDVSSHGPVAQLFRSTSDHTTTERLCALDVVLLPLALVAPPGDREIRFVRVAGTNPTPLAEWFTELRQRDDEAGVLRVSRKLAGNQLGNFSAFLRPEYRANDWMWGRVDSAHALLGILLDPRRTQARLLGGTSIDELLEALRRAASARSWLGDADVDARWREHAPVVRRELEMLRDDQEGTASLAQTTELFRRWRHVELTGRELPKVLAMVRGDVPTPASEADLEQLAATYKVVPDKIALRPLREILPNVDQLRQVAYTAVRGPLPDGEARPPRDDGKARSMRRLGWAAARANTVARFLLRHRLGWVIGAAVVAALLLLTGLVLAFLPVGNWLPIGAWVGAILVLAGGVLLARKRLRLVEPLSDAFTTVD